MITPIDIKTIIAIDKGHGTGSDRGAVGLIAEEFIINAVGDLVIYKLTTLGYTVIECRPNTSSSVGNSLNQRCSTANNAGANLFVSIHANAGGGVGTEVFTNGARQNPKAVSVLQNLVALGLRNRGIKDGSGFAVIRGTSMEAMLVEICFVDTQSDVDLYNSLGANAIADAIVKGITGTTVSVTPTPVQVQPQASTPSVSYNFVSVASRYLGSAFKIKLVQLLLNCFGYSLDADGICGQNTANAIGDFQTKYNLGKDYKFGPACFNKAKELISGTLCGLPYRTPNESKVIQHILGLTVDGIFGKGSANSVIAFQKKNGLVADGLIGRMTWSKLF